MKKVFLGIIVVCAMMLSTFAFAAPLLYVGTSDGSDIDYHVLPGETFTVDISIANINELPAGLDITDFSFSMSIQPDDGNLLTADPLNFVAGHAIDASSKMFMMGASGPMRDLVEIFYSPFVTSPPPLVDGLVGSFNLETLGVGNWSLVLEDVAFGMGGTSVEVITQDGSVNAVPIPSTVLLFGSGLFGLMGIGRRRMKKS
jgi:hypothetical protein